VNAVAPEPTVPQDLPVLQPRQGVFHPGSRPAVDGVLRFLLSAEVRLTSSFAVRDEQAGSLVGAVGDGRVGAPRQTRSTPDSKLGVLPRDVGQPDEGWFAAGYCSGVGAVVMAVMEPGRQGFAEG
jgi:hypothetical protein